MDYPAIPEDRWRTMQHAVENSRTIREKVAEIIRRLDKLFSEGDVRNNIGLVITATGSEPVIANVSTPVGKARLLLRFAVESDRLVGHLILRREQHDKFDAAFWEPVMGIRVPVDGPASVGIGEGALVIPLPPFFTQMADNAMFSLGMWMMYSIADGPIQTD